MSNMATVMHSIATWTSLRIELPAIQDYAALHGLPPDIGRLIFEGNITNRDLVAPIVMALSPSGGEQLLAIVINSFGDPMNRERVLGSIVVEAGLNEMRAVADVGLALAEASTLAAEEIVFIRARSVDTDVIAKAMVTGKTPLFKFENRTYRGAIAKVLSPEFTAAFISSSHSSVEVFGRGRAIWPLIQTVSVMTVPS